MACGEPRDDNVRALGTREEAFAVAGIEQVVEFRRELAVILVALGLGEQMEFTCGCDAVGAQPRIAPVAPFARDARRHGIRQPRGDEIRDAPLPPVREPLPVDMQFAGGSERLECHAADAGNKP